MNPAAVFHLRELTIRFGRSGDRLEEVSGVVSWWRKKRRGGEREEWNRGATPIPEPPEFRADRGIREHARAKRRWAAMNRPRWRWSKYAITGSRPEPVPSFIGTVEAPMPGKLGICCSGGGIRSAAFNLGALHGSAHARP
jgi:hypothetical protein